jgi:TetR/AcrR family transcriptional regulator
MPGLHSASVRSPRLSSRGKPGQSRAAILRAAAREFAENGIAGARTDAIARLARVNKALLYYYFEDKETLYGAVLDHAFAGMRSEVLHVLDSDLPPREKIIAYVAAYFDFVACHPIYPRLMQREMMRVRDGRSKHLSRIVRLYFQPIYRRLGELLREGVARGEFRQVDPVHFISSMLSVIVFYFTAAPVMERLVGFNPLAPRRVAERRVAVLDFISAALFPPRAASQGARS